MTKQWKAAMIAAAICGCTGGSPSTERFDPGDAGPQREAPKPTDPTNYYKDSDGDTIRDDEELGDTDGDGAADLLDLDSDGDGISDADEAGDADVHTKALDTDDDLQPDFADTDSDNDGILDSDEASHGTSRVLSDSDGDGASDSLELAAMTSPTDAAQNPRANGDFVFVVPYMGTPQPERGTVNAATGLHSVDLYFGFDVTSSMLEELAAMRSSAHGVPAIISALVCDPVHPAAGCIENISTGLGTFDNLDTFQNRVSIQPDPMVTALRIPGTPSRGSFEAPIQAADCVADGANCDNSTKNCASTGIGCAGFRDDAVRIYVQITEANNQCSGDRCDMFTTAAAGADLAAHGIKFIGLANRTDNFPRGVGTADGIAREIGVASGTVDAHGNAYVYDALNDEVADRTVEAVQALTQAATYRATIEAADPVADAVDVLALIERFETNTSGGVCTQTTTADSDGDRFPDEFTSIAPGTSVCFDVVAAMNHTVASTASMQVFKANLTIRVDGSPVDAHVVYFVIPATAHKLDVG